MHVTKKNETHFKVLFRFINWNASFTSNTEPYEPTPRVFPVDATSSKKYCCNLEFFQKFPDQLTLLAMIWYQNALK